MRVAFRLEPVRGIGPPNPAWKAGVLPLNYTGVFPERQEVNRPGPVFPGCQLKGSDPPGFPKPEWSQLPDSNRRPPGPEPGALPSALNRGMPCRTFRCGCSRLIGAAFRRADAYGLGLYYKEKRTPVPTSGVVEQGGVEPPAISPSHLFRMWPGALRPATAVFPAANCKWRFQPFGRWRAGPDSNRLPLTVL